VTLPEGFMNSIRVHSSTPGNPEVARYLILSFAGPGRISIDLTPLGGDPGLTTLILSQDALYDVLMGKDLVVSLSEVSLVFTARGEELIVAIRSDIRSTPLEYRVWLAEVALGWNVLSRSANSWI
jgi:hypothetical protein